MKKLLVVVVLLMTVSLFGQDIKFSTKDNDLKLATLPYYNYGRGL